MRYPIARVRPLEDDEVDRSEGEVQQCMELTDTNRSRAWPEGLGKMVVAWLFSMWFWRYMWNVLNARVAQWWSTTLPRWGPRVRIPSRALFIGWNCLIFQEFQPFCILWKLVDSCRQEERKIDHEAKEHSSCSKRYRKIKAILSLTLWPSARA